MVPKPYPEGRQGRVCLGGGYIVSYAVQYLDGVVENSNKLSDLDCFKTSEIALGKWKKKTRGKNEGRLSFFVLVSTR